MEGQQTILKPVAEIVLENIKQFIIQYTEIYTGDLMIITDKREFIIKIISTILIIILNLMVIINGLNLDCDKCKIRFHSEKATFTEAYDQPLNTFELNANNLYNNYLNDVCMIKWDKVNGYYLTKME